MEVDLAELEPVPARYVEDAEEQILITLRQDRGKPRCLPDKYCFHCKGTGIHVERGEIIYHFTKVKICECMYR